MARHIRVRQLDDEVWRGKSIPKTFGDKFLPLFIRSSLKPRISSRTIAPRFKVALSPKEREYDTTPAVYVSIAHQRKIARHEPHRARKSKFRTGY